jgi:hypothetical protein
MPIAGQDVSAWKDTLEFIVDCRDDVLGVPFGIVLRLPMFAAGMEGIAARPRRKRVHQQTVRRPIAGNKNTLPRGEILPRLLFVIRRPWRPSPALKTGPGAEVILDTVVTIRDNAALPSSLRKRGWERNQGCSW